jgi:hypothetical protein
MPLVAVRRQCGHNTFSATTGGSLISVGCWLAAAGWLVVIKAKNIVGAEGMNFRHY